MTQYTGHYPLVISDAVKSNANATWDLIDTDTGGYATFSVPLSPSGSPNPTHWGTYTMLDVECLEALQGRPSAPDPVTGAVTYTPYTNAEFTAFLQARSIKLGRPMPNNPGQFRAQFSMGKEYQNFYDFLAELGLQRVAAQAQAQAK